MVKRAIVILMALGVGVLMARAGDKVMLRADTWYPYNGDPAAEKPGYMIEIAKAVFEKAGLTVDYQTKGWTWDRSIAEGRKGTIDGIVGAAKEDAPDFLFSEESLGIQVQTFFVKKGNPWRFKDLETLKGVKLGIISGYAYGDDVDGYIKDNKDKGAAVQVLQDDNALELNIKKLQAGRIDVIIEDAAVFSAKATELGLADQFEVAGTTAVPKPAYIAFSPAKETSKKYSQMLSDGIKALRASGELQKILAKYHIDDWQKK